MNITETIKPEESPLTLRNRGIDLHTVSPFIQWKFVETEEEYKAVVQLRVKAYSGAGKIDSTHHHLMRDQYDRDACILVGWHFSKPVASLRIMVHPSGRRWEHEQFLSLNSPELPPKSQTAEITRVCTDPEWRGTDLSKLLFQRTAIEVLRLKKRYLLGSAISTLLPLYTKIGCSPTNLKYEYKGLAGGLHTIFFVDLEKSLNGYENPFHFWPVWSVMWSDIQKEAVRTGLLSPPPSWQSAKLWFWMTLKPFFQWLDTQKRGKARGT